MKCYGGFALMYDALMADTPYDIWVSYIDGLLGHWFKERESSAAPLVLDLACGTGNVTIPLAQKGYDLIGVDVSEDMLAEAQRKAFEENQNILFLAQDMRKLDLYGTIDAAVCVCDGLNYILTDEDILTVFKRVRLFLNPGGVFVFDMNTEYKFRVVFDDKTFEGEGAGGERYVWENKYDPATGVNEYEMLFYNMNGGEPFTETHRQRAYPPALICNMLFEAGFKTAAMRDGYSGNPLNEKSARVVFIAS